MSNIENNFSYNNIFIKLNEIFKNLEVDIKNDIYNINKIKTRKGKISFTDALINKLKYSELGITKLNLISEYNFNNSSSVSRTTFYEKEKLIPLITYENIF